MRLHRSIAGVTDYTFHGTPCEVTGIDLFVDKDLSPEEIAECERNQELALKHSRKSVLWSDYWRGLAAELKGKKS